MCEFEKQKQIKNVSWFVGFRFSFSTNNFPSPQQARLRKAFISVPNGCESTVSQRFHVFLF